MFNQRPPAPRYQSVWNVGVVIRHIQSQSQLTDLPLKEVSRRLVVLLALSNASRTSDLHALDLRFRQFTPEWVTFRIPVLTKTRRSGPPKEAFFAKFADDEAVCPVQTLKFYKEKNDYVEGSRSYGACSSIYLIPETTQTSIISFNSPMDERTAKRSWGGYRRV